MTANTVTANAAPPRATRREWVGLAVLALPCLLLALDSSVLYLALPHLAADLGASSTQQLWITDIYGFLIAGFLITMGTLGDRIGRRRLLLIGGAAFGVASVLAAFSTSPEMLIATRALLGIAGATLMPSTLALITNMFRDPKQLSTAFAVWISCFMGGAALGPVVGGALLENFWWGSAFLLGVPVMALLLALGPMFLPEYRDAGQTGRLDLTSVGLSLATILPVIYGLKEAASHGLQIIPAAAIVAGVAVGVVFVRRQNTLASPLLDLRLFSNRPFTTALGLWLLIGASMGGIGLLLSLYMQMVLGLSPMEAGLWQLPGVVAMITASMMAPRLARRFRPGSIMAAGLALAAVGILIIAQLDAGSGVALLVSGQVLMMIGVGVGMPLGQGLVMTAAPPEKAGSASAMSETSGEFGIALGVATLGSVGTAVYRGQVDVPAGVPAAVAETARESIAGAVITAQQLPATVGADLLDSARAAFSAGLSTVATLSIVIFVGLTVVAATVLRRVRPIGEDVAEQAPSVQSSADPTDNDPEGATALTAA